MRAPVGSTSRIAARSNGEQSAQLLDERRERRVEVERRAECARGAARRLEHVDSSAELVAQPLRLGGALLGGASLAPLHVHEPTDDAAERDRDEHAEHERVVPHRRIELGLAPELQPQEDRQREAPTTNPPAQPEEQRASSTTRKSSERNGCPGSQAKTNISAVTTAASATKFSAARYRCRPRQR